MSSVAWEAVQATAGQMHSAGLGEASWEEALDSLAKVTGSVGAQLIGLGSTAGVSFNVMTGVPPEAGEQFVAVGGSDPTVNSRVRVGRQAAELQVLDETAFTTADDMRLNPEYAQWCKRYDLHNACITNLVASPVEHAGLALLRNASQGNVNDEQKRVFTALAAHARAAVRTQMALDGQGSKLLAGALESVGTLAFVCDETGRVRSMTASAEALLSSGDVLRLRQGVLTTACESNRTGLEAALGEALRGGVPTFTVVARHLQSDDRLILEAVPLRRGSAPSLGRRALVIVHGPGVKEARVALAAGLIYGLTPSEAAVAAQLATGQSPGAIAHRRQVSIVTIRTQVRRIFDKVGVSSQIELVARLPRP